MSRKNNRKRRDARKERAPSHQSDPKGLPKPWGENDALTDEERSRALSRFGGMKFRSFSTGFVPMFDGVRAKNPEELNAAVASALSSRSSGKPSN